MKTDWKDDIFTRRKLRMVDNGDGTVTPEDATDYTQRGDSFGAKELNTIGEEVNEIKNLSVMEKPLLPQPSLRRE